MSKFCLFAGGDNPDVTPREDDGEAEETPDSDEEEEFDLDDWPTVHMERNLTHTFEYTEHEMVVGFSSGKEKTFVFDDIGESPNGYILYDYVEGEMGSAVEKQTTLVYENVEYMDTLSRTEMEMEEEEHEEWDEVPLPVAKDRLNRYPDRYTIDTSDVSDETLEACPAVHRRSGDW